MSHTESSRRFPPPWTIKESCRAFELSWATAQRAVLAPPPARVAARVLAWAWASPPREVEVAEERVAERTFVQLATTDIAGVP